MRNYYTLLKESAINHILTIVWVAVGSVLIALLYFLHSFFAPYGLFFAGFGSASVAIVLLSAILIYFKSRWNKQQEQQQMTKFTSKDKGYLDHRVDMEKATRDITAKTIEITKEIKLIGKDANSARSKIQSVKNDPVKQQKLASNLAQKFRKRYSNIDKYLGNYEEIAKLQIESTMKFFERFTPKDKNAEGDLHTMHEIFKNLVQTTQKTITSMQSFLNSNDSLKGISQDLNTSLNMGSAIIGKYIQILKKSEKEWKEIIKVIDKKWQET